MGVAQFFAYVYPEKKGYRVVVEGIADAHAESLADAERQARALIERAIRASHPDRTARPSPAAAALIELDLRVVRARPQPAEQRMDGPPPAQSPARRSGAPPEG